MNIRSIDLNLLVYLAVLLEEQSVSKAANKLALTQPTLSAALKRLRTLFNDPLLVRTSQGMTLTERAVSLKPQLAEFIKLSEQLTQTDTAFDPCSSERNFKVIANDYIEISLLFPFIAQCIDNGYSISFDILSPSNSNVQQLEEGTVDLAINRFNLLPNSLHQQRIWRDNFCVLCHQDNPYNHQPTLEQYLALPHIWVNRSGLGDEANINVNSHPAKLGLLDEALWQVQKRRTIKVFSRHYQIVQMLNASNKLLATVPKRLLASLEPTQLAVHPVPFQMVPMEVKMVWSPIKHYDPAHIWLRKQLLLFAQNSVAG